MNFANPSAFLLLIPFALVCGYIFWQRKNRTPSIQFSNSSVFLGIAKGWKSYLSKLPVIFKCIAIFLAIIALARPQKSSTKTKKNVEGIDIVIALDISDSMLIEDMLPQNRLESAKKTIENFISKRSTDRIGLVVFSGESFTRVPLTTDYQMLFQSLKEVSSTRKVKMGTAIGVALANSVARLKDSVAKSRVVILLTDGESNSGTISPDMALEIAKGYSIRVYTIGIGKDGQTRLPVYRSNGRGGRVKTYQPFYSKVNEALLQSLAKETGGKYYRATKTKGLQGVFNDIDSLEKTKIELNQYTKYTELFQKVLIWSLIFYSLAFVIQRFVLRRLP